MALAAVAAIVVAPAERDDRIVQAAGSVCDTDCGAGGEFHPITPVRALDSRRPDLDVSPRGTKATGPTNPSFEIELTGVGGIPEFTDDNGDGFDDNVLAIVANVTITGPSRAGHVTGFGNGEPAPNASIVNFPAGGTVANSAVLRPGRDGKLTFQLFSQSPGRTHIVIDVMGWISTSSYETNGSRLLPTSPYRLRDTRFDGSKRPLGPSSQIPITIQDSSAYPGLGVDFKASDVVGVLVNVTSVNRESNSAATYFSAVPDAVPSGQEPSTSNLNIVAQDTRAAMAFVPLGGDPTFYLFNRHGFSHAVVDLMGVMVKGKPGDTRDGRIVPLVTAFRVFDTRMPEFGGSPLGPGQAESWDFSEFVADVKISGDWVGEQAGMIGNLTGLLTRQYPSQRSYSHITFFPQRSDPKDVPDTSNLNLADGQTIPNMTVTRFGGSAGNEGVSAFNAGGNLHYLYDVYAVILQD